MKTRNTRQKLILEKKIKKFSKFFDAKELLAETKKEDKTIGIATIYRFLKELNKKEEIHLYICSRKRIYSVKSNNHCHFICEKCGKISHFDIDQINFLKNKTNGEICHFQVDVYGICEKCGKTGNKSLLR